MIDITLLAGVTVILSSVVLVFGCVCHLFKRGAGFTTFDNDPEAGFGNNVYSPTDTSEISQVTFETIPDILAKTVTATALRPRISCTDGEIQKQSAKRVASYKAFPRSHLTYIKEMGVGWFGQVLVSEAYNMVTSSRSTRVVVKMMKDDANSTEQQLFLQDLSVYRELDHPNVLKLLGQCTEAPPLLAIIENASMGDLKSYLRKECQIVKNMKGGTMRMQFLTDMAAGLECLHTNGYLHHDFACRNCVVMSNMTVKIGDYGVAEDHFREDYYDNGQDLLPIRWMSPESIILSNSIWQIKGFTKESNIWSFGVAMYEVTECGQQPYQEMTDEMVLQNMIAQNPTMLQLPHTDDPVKSQLYQIMKTCWQAPSRRPSIDEMHAQLRQIQSEKDAADEAEFERKWAKISSKEARVVKVEVHASDISHVTRHNAVDNVTNRTENLIAPDFNSNSLSVESQTKGEKLVTGKIEEKLSSCDNSINNEPIEIVSGRLDDLAPAAIPLNLILNTSGVTTPIKDRPLVHHFTSTPVLTNKDDVMKSHRSETSTAKMKSAQNDNHIDLPKISYKKPPNEVRQCDVMDSTENSHNSHPLFVHDSADGKTLLVNKYNIKPDEVISTDVKYNIKENSKDKLNTFDVDIEDSKSCNTEKVSKQFDNIDSFIDFENNYEEYKISGHISLSEAGDSLPQDGKVLKHMEMSDMKNSNDSFEDRDHDDEIEKLKQLKLTLSGVLPGGNAHEKNDEKNGISSPTMDDMDIAREIYMSKGMSMPPSKYTSTRSLNTILEDELLSENEPQPLTKTSSSDLKFVEPMDDYNVSDSYQDSFEWDDFIGDELIGRVKNSEISSPRQSIDIDWTMEHDSSSQDSEIQNGSKLDENSSIANDKKFSPYNTPFSSSESEVKNTKSVMGAAAHSKSPKSPVGAAAHSYVKHILSNRISNNSNNKGISFYSFSHNIDMDEHAEPSSTTSSFNKASQYNLMDEWDL